MPIWGKREHAWITSNEIWEHSNYLTHSESSKLASWYLFSPADFRLARDLETFKTVHWNADVSKTNQGEINLFVNLPRFSIFAKRQLVCLHPHVLEGAVTALSSHACYHMEVA